MPAIFVLLWSSGFIGAKYGLPYAEPFTFLLVRFVIVTVLLAALAWWTRAPWPRSAREVAHIAIAGLLVHACYLGGVFSAIAGRVSAGEMALIAGLQPALTGLLAGPWLGERLSLRGWLGVALGFAGVALVVLGRGTVGAPQASSTAYLQAFFALASMTLGTLYQKRHCSHMDLRSGSVIQFAVSAVVMVICASLLEHMRIVWRGEFLFALGWLVVVLSLGAISLLYALIRRGQATHVASYFYLVPPVTAILAYAAFGERLSPLALVGLVLTVLGVALVVRRQPPNNPPAPALD